jgi:hypothetical protein
VFFSLTGVKMTLYISGKITDNENFFQDFQNAQGQLERAGYNVFNPAGGSVDGETWAEAMKIDIRHLLTCDGVAYLNNWQESKGALIETRLARDLGMMVKPLKDWLKTREGLCGPVA